MANTHREMESGQFSIVYFLSGLELRWNIFIIKRAKNANQINFYLHFHSFVFISFVWLSSSLLRSPPMLFLFSVFSFSNSIKFYIFPATQDSLFFVDIFSFCDETVGNQTANALKRSTLSKRSVMK